SSILYRSFLSIFCISCTCPSILFNLVITFFFSSFSLASTRFFSSIPFPPLHPLYYTPLSYVNYKIKKLVQEFSSTSFSNHYSVKSGLYNVNFAFSFSMTSPVNTWMNGDASSNRSEEHTSELQSRFDLVCRLLLEKKNKIT